MSSFWFLSFLIQIVVFFPHLPFPSFSVHYLLLAHLFLNTSYNISFIHLTFYRLLVSYLSVLAYLFLVTNYSIFPLSGFLPFPCFSSLYLSFLSLSSSLPQLRVRRSRLPLFLISSLLVQVSVCLSLRLTVHLSLPLFLISSISLISFLVQVSVCLSLHLTFHVSFVSFLLSFRSKAHLHPQFLFLGFYSAPRGFPHPTTSHQDPRRASSLVALHASPRAHRKTLDPERRVVFFLPPWFAAGMAGEAWVSVARSLVTGWWGRR